MFTWEKMWDGLAEGGPENLLSHLKVHFVREIPLGPVQMFLTWTIPPVMYMSLGV